MAKHSSTTSAEAANRHPRGGILAVLRRIADELSYATDTATLFQGVAEAVCCDATRAEACSIFLAESQGYRLAASHGPDRNHAGTLCLVEAIEGLVGQVATSMEPLNLADARRHPRFRPRPGCGEEALCAFLGVPLVYRGRLLGVLVVQRHTRRRFTDAQVAFLSTLAPQLAMVLAAEIPEQSRASPTGGAHPRQTGTWVISGVGGAPGIALGTGLVLLAPDQLETLRDREAVDITAEIAALDEAVSSVVEDLRRLSASFGESLSAEDRALFDAYAAIAASAELKGATTEAIRAGNWAPGALRQTIQGLLREFEGMEDPYLRGRATDIRGIGGRILAQLLRQSDHGAPAPQDAILVGHDLTPMELADMDPQRVRGIVSAQGAAYSHICIFARALGIPAVAGLSPGVDLGRLEGRTLVVDGYQGRVHVDPDEAVRREYSYYLHVQRHLDRELDALRDLPAQTPDGVRVHLYTNVGLSADLTHSLEVGAEGVGLYRTELPFLLAERLPSEEEQYGWYREALERMAPRPVTLRTLDLGADKSPAYFPVTGTNPALGWRGIRISLDQPEIFLTQLRAMLRANAGLGNLRIMFPMVSGVEELERAKAYLRQAQLQVASDGLGAAIGLPPVGVMIEVPSLALAAAAVARRVEFLSVGTNDLTQYLLAADRSNPQVADLLDPLHPAVLRAVAFVVRAALRAGREVSVCGEAAADPLAAVLYLGLGVHALSVTAGDLPKIKWVMRSIPQSQARQLLRRALRSPSSARIRAMMERGLHEAGLGRLRQPDLMRE